MHRVNSLRRVRHAAYVSIAALIAACSDKTTAPLSPVADRAREGERDNGVGARNINCAPDNGGITLPSGFCAVVFADLTMDGQPAAARHMVVTPTGDLFVAINSPRNANPSSGIIGLRDNDGDGRADQETRFSSNLGGNGLAFAEGTLYFAANDRVLRFPVPVGQLSPVGPAQTVVSGLASSGDHISKTLVLLENRQLLVNIGSASNACQVENRVAQSPGVYPCPELSTRAGVWKFNGNATNQTLASGDHFARGYRNTVAMARNHRTGEVWGIPHGRDMLFENWPQFFNQQEDATMPAEEFALIGPGSDNGWPYCYYDAVFNNKKVLAPEYGGDGQIVKNANVDCSTKNQPSVSFGAHWAPNGLTFYRGTQFPQRYRNGAFIAFHGGFDRAPLPNEGYQVQFVPFGLNGRPTGAAEKFADGFAGSSGPLPASALHRPVGVTEGPDGSLYVSDDRGGRIYRIVYRGN